MANDLNLCLFIGRLGADPETRFAPNGTAVTNIRIAVGKKWKDKNGQTQEATEWVPIVLFSRLAEVAGEYLKKGSRVRINGEFKTRKWEDQQGNTRYTTEIVASEMQMLDGRGDAQTAGQQDTRPQQNRAPAQGGGYGPSAPADEFSDDIPFAPLDWRLA
ncbi:MAG: single-stranded DNA-binding protein [Alcanivorax sediminis]|uniref:single-stranded DNA-binding protein n=1 Tax=Alcanivorax sediminis TaxID=2663008 RepID=UPI003C610229